jgi:hypothetical protein
MDKTTIIYACSVYNVSFAIFHIGFWKLFNWKTELAKLHFTNRAIMQIFNMRIIYLASLMAFIYFRYPQELLNTPLGKVVLIGMCLFWAGRTIEQFIFFKLNNTRVNLMTIIFIIGTVLHFLCFYN